MTLRFAVDTGGTFTDLVVARDDAALSMHKVPTTPADPVAGVLDSLRVAADAAGEAFAAFLAQGEILVHGTTHAINAIVTGTTARTALLTTQGHPDTLVFREGGRTEPFNFTVPYPEPLVPKALTFELPERVRVDGGILVPLDEAATIAVLERLAETQIQAVAVCLLWSVVNPVHEIAVGRLIERHLPGIPYSLSHAVNPSIREFRRASSTCMDAALKPVMGAYMRGLSARLREAGFSGRVLVATSQGGMMEAGDAAGQPVQLINSGPSLAPVAARAYADAETLIVGDAGGTTFDVSLVRGGRIPRTRETWLGQPFRSFMTGLPSVDVRSIGAGGGSIAWVDAGGLLHVGPISAGAVPGPVCYGHGGTRPTVTDAALALGLIDAGFFLGGQMRLDQPAALAAIARDVAAPLGLAPNDAAAAIMALATEHMVQAIMDITVSQGIDPAGATYVAGGGAAGLNCVAIARRLGCREVIVPETGAALSAAGATLCEIASQRQAFFHTDSRRFDRDGVNATLARLEAECARFAASSGASGDAVAVDLVVEARYPDQAWEIDVPLRQTRIADAAAVAALVADFHAAHQAMFAVHDPGSAVEAVGWRAEIRCRIGSAVPGRLHPLLDAPPPPSRRAWFAETGWIEADVHRFETLTGCIAGPAIVESGFTCVAIDPGATAFRDGRGSLVIAL